MRNKSFIINYLYRLSCAGHPTIGTAFAQVASEIVESGTVKRPSTATAGTELWVLFSRSVRLWSIAVTREYHRHVAVVAPYRTVGCGDHQSIEIIDK
jgi:hypothetical protein